MISAKQTNKKKADCTPEEWAAHLEYHRLRHAANREKERARQREYRSRPEVKERRRLRDSTPEAKAKRRAYAHTPEAKARAKELVAARKADPDRHEKRLSAQRKRRTGMTNSDVQKLLEFQGNKCAVCEREFDGRQIRADHCHDSGKPRGLLCHHCNIIEGMLRGMALSPNEFAERLHKYLDSPPASCL
ncbi:MAG TPA: endonuclease domain-containing protein [Aquabacterium sp.]|nr:endonuclease domain-containing protein [Aquabacterium sp.]